MSSLEAVVRELRLSAARASALRYLLHALLASAAWILAIVIVARFVPLDQVLKIAAAGVPLAFAGVAAAWVAARPRPMRLMRTADLTLGLKERLSTAWERRSEHGPMDGERRRDRPSLGPAEHHPGRAAAAAALRPSDAGACERGPKPGQQLERHGVRPCRRAGHQRQPGAGCASDAQSGLAAAESLAQRSR